MATKLASSKAKHILLLLDCCGAGLAADMPRGSTPPLTPDYAALLKQRTKVAITAGTGKESALEPSDREHSYFTQAILDVLNRNVSEEPWASSEVFSAKALSSYVQRVVNGQTSGRQTPNYMELPGHGGGDFIFDLRGTRPNSRGADLK